MRVFAHFFALFFQFPHSGNAFDLFFSFSRTDSNGSTGSSEPQKMLTLEVPFKGEHSLKLKKTRFAYLKEVRFQCRTEVSYLPSGVHRRSGSVVYSKCCQGGCSDAHKRCKMQISKNAPQMTRRPLGREN